MEDTEKEDSEVLKGLSEEVPKQAKVGGLVRDRKTADIEFEHRKNSVCTWSDKYMYMHNHNYYSTIISEYYHDSNLHSHDTINSLQKVPRFDELI